MAELQALAVQFFGVGFGGATVLGLLAQIWPAPPDSIKKNPNRLEISVGPIVHVETDADDGAQTQEIYNTTAAIQQATDHITTVTHTETEYVAQHITVDRTFTSTSTVIHQPPAVTVTQAPTLIEITDPVSSQALSPRVDPAQGFHTSDLPVILSLVLCILGLILSPILAFAFGIHPHSSHGSNEDESKDTAVNKDWGVQTEAIPQKHVAVQMEAIVQKDAAVQKDEIRDPTQPKLDCHCNESKDFWTEKHAYTGKRSLKNDESKAMFDILHGIFDEAGHCLTRKEMADILSGKLKRRASDNQCRALEIVCSSEDHIRESALAKTLAQMDYDTFVESDQINVSSMLLMQKGPLVENALLRNWLNRLAKTTKLVEEASAHIHAGCPDDVRDPKVRPQRFTRSPDRVRRSGPVRLQSKMRNEDPIPGRSSPNDSAVPEQRDSDSVPDLSKENESRPLLMGRHDRLREVLKKANVEEPWKLRNLSLIRQIVGLHGKDIDAAAKEVQLLYEGYLLKHRSTAAEEEGGKDSTPVVAVPVIKIDDPITTSKVAPEEDSEQPDSVSAAEAPVPQNPELIPENDRSSSPLSEPPSAEQWNRQGLGHIPETHLSTLPAWSPLSAERFSPISVSLIHQLCEAETHADEGIATGDTFEPDTATKSGTHEKSLKFVQEQADSAARATERIRTGVDNSEEVQGTLPTPPETTIKTIEAVQHHSGSGGQDTERNAVDVASDERLKVTLPTPPESATEDAGADHDEDVEALASQLVADALQLDAAATAGDKVENVPAVYEDDAFANSNLDAKITTEQAIEDFTPAAGHVHKSDADSDSELEKSPNAPYQNREEHKDASSVEGTSAFATERQVATDQAPTSIWTPEPGTTEDKPTPEQVHNIPHQQQPSLTSPPLEYETTSYQRESNIEELTDAWINSVDQSQPEFGFPEGPVVPDSYPLPDEDSAMDGLEATGVAVPAAAPPTQSASVPVAQQAPLQTETPLQQGPVPDSLNEDTDTYFEDVYMPNGQTIEAFQNATEIAGPGFPNASVSNESRETEMPDDAAPPTPSDGRGPIDETQGCRNQRHGMQTHEPPLTIDTRRRDTGYNSASDFDPFSATLPTDPDLFESNSTQYHENIERENNLQRFESNVSRDYDGEERENGSSDVGLSPLGDDSPTYNYSQDAAQNDSTPSMWRYAKDEYVISPSDERVPYAEYEAEDPYAADIESDVDLPLNGSVPTNSATPVPSVRPDYSTPPSHSTSSTLVNPTSSTLEGFSGPKNGISAPYRPLEMSPTRFSSVAALARTPAPDSQISSAAAIALGLSQDGNSDKSSESSDEEMDVKDEQVEVDEKQAAIDAAAAELTARMDAAHAANAAAATAVSPLRDPRISSAAAIALGLRRDDSSDESSEMSDEQEPAKHEQVDIEEDQAKIDADAAALMERMDNSHAANVATAAGLSQAQQPQQGFSVFEMTSRLHAFVEPNRRRLESLKERAAAVAESRSDGIPKHWKERIDEIARTLGQSTDEAMRVNRELMQEWEALDEDTIKRWSWEGTDGRRREIASRVACTEMMARLLDLLAGKVGDDGWRRKVRWAIIGQGGVARSRSCAALWREIENAAGVPSTKVNKMQVDLEQLVDELAAEQAEMQSLADQLTDLEGDEADEEIRRLLRGEDDDESDLSEIDDEVLARTEDDPVASMEV